ncbi:MAG: glycosyltransferase [Terracidiphilus sp.]|nr:glycosyltransferase [Terracidiphilus sp.]
MNQVSMKVSHTASSQTILPILVLYNGALETSETYRTLIASAHNASLDPPLIAVYDNSPLRQVNGDEEARLFAYKHDPSNSGIAVAYNWALDLAQSYGFSWLLLLDEDTQLPSSFWGSLLGVADLYDANLFIAAIVPFVKDGLAEISPRRVRFGRLSPLHKQSPSLVECEVTAINSGSAIRVSFVQLLGGFNPDYRLDYLDHWLFRQLYAQGKRVALSGSVLKHDLSVSDYRKKVSQSRYRSILTAEVLFVTTQKPRVERLVYVIKLVLRAVKQLIVYRRPKLVAMTCRMAVKLAARGIGWR